MSAGHRNTSLSDHMHAGAEFVRGWPYGSRWEGIMDDHEPTIRSRELGEGLRRAMVDAGLTGRQAARLLGRSQSWVSRLLSDKT